MPSDVAPDPEEAPVPARAVDSAGSGSPEADEAPAPVPASDDTPEPAGPERPEAPAEGREPEALEGSGDRAEPDDEIPELELELKPYDDSVPYSAEYTASPGAEQPDEPSKEVSEPEADAEPTAEVAPEPGVDGTGRPGAPETETTPETATDTAPEPAEAEATGPGDPGPPRAESHEADAVPARATEAADESAPEPTPPTDAPEPPAPEADAEAVPERAEAAKPPADALQPADAAPEPTAPIDAPEPQAEGARGLAAHAENEAEPVEAHEGRTPASGAEAAGAAGAAAETGETALPGDGNGIRQDHEAEAEPTTEGSEDEAERYGNSALRDGPSYQQEIDDQLGARGLDRSEHDKLRLTPTNELTEAQAREVVGVRDAIKLGEDRMVTKVLKPEVAQAYLDNATRLNSYDFNPGEFRGSIARGSDTADLRSMDQLRDGLALDDGGAGWTPVPPGASEAYQLRFPAPHGMRADATLGAVGDQALADRVAGIAGQSPGRAWDAPFLGTGYTGGGVPEWDAKPTGFPDHAEIWRMHADGTEEAVGFFDRNEGLWNYYD
ncbi:hypothetical protein [Streptomyces sp. NPDC046182]|uniref:hypothetical protein n=1 Tax=Streptomyces sp. NPDC046182 TaxID=3154601 RepID=UPI00340507DE